MNYHHPDGEIISARRNGLDLPSTTFNKITRFNLRFHPYQMIKRYQQMAADYLRRQQFSHWLRAQNACFLENVIIDDGAGFSRNASVNTHNVRHYAPRGQHPLDFQFGRNDDRHKLTVWVSLMGKGNIINWSVLFPRNVDGEGFLQMINQQVVGECAVIASTVMGGFKGYSGNKTVVISQDESCLRTVTGTVRGKCGWTEPSRRMATKIPGPNSFGFFLVRIP